jgi:hypothetical protein
MDGDCMGNMKDECMGLKLVLETWHVSMGGQCQVSRLTDKFWGVWFLSN